MAIKLNTIVIGIGSNIEPNRYIKRAKRAIAKRFKIINASQFIRTEPIGYKDQDLFLNGAVLIETELEYEEMRTWLRQLEESLGRVRDQNRYGPRTIDLDILVWNQSIVDDDVYTRGFLQSSISELIPDLDISMTNRE